MSLYLARVFSDMSSNLHMSDNDMMVPLILVCTVTVFLCADFYSFSGGLQANHLQLFWTIFALSVH